MSTNGSTEYSAAPGTPQSPTKAIAATVLAFVTIFVSAWIADDNGATGQEILTWIISAVIGSGITGGATYQVKNKAKVLTRR
jgi:hypothetical protein